MNKNSIDLERFHKQVLVPHIVKEQLLGIRQLNTFWDIWKQVTEKHGNMNTDFQANFGPCPHGDSVTMRAAKKKKFCIAGRNENGHFLYIPPENNICP